MCLFVLIDSRLTPQEVDLEFMQFISASQSAFCDVFYKNKISFQKRREARTFKIIKNECG